MSTKLKKLSKQERFCFDSLKTLEQLAEHYSEATDKENLEGWKERLEAIFIHYEQTRLELELLPDFQPAVEEAQGGESKEAKPSVDDLNQNARAEFELSYLKLKSYLVAKIRNCDQPKQHGVPENQARSAPTPLHTRVKLPEIKLPLFDGSIKEWPTFRDSFKSLIDSSTQLSKVDKFSYLVSSLSKDAQRVIEVIEVTSDNYSVAWELLERRYDNKYLIVKSYVEALFSVEPMKKECHESLNRLIDDYERNLKMLEKVGEQPQHWSTLLVFMLSSRLDQSTMRQWETHRKSSNVPTYSELIDFLRSHSLVLQSVAATTTVKPRAPDHPRPTSSVSTLRSATPKFNTVHSAITTSQKYCPFCKQPTHSAFHCEVFRKMTAMQRFEATKKNALCINCLSSSHMVRNCSSGSCRVCGQKHHAMLHQRTNTPYSQTNQSQSIKPISSSSNSSAASSTQNNQSQSSQLNKPLQSPENQAPTVSALSTSHFSMPSRTQSHIPSTVLLSTAFVKVLDSAGHFLWARALLDSGSQLIFVSEQLVQKLDLTRLKEFMPISGVGLSSISSKYSTKLRIQSHRADFDASWKFHVLSRITMELPNQAVDFSLLRLPSDIVLADPSFHTPGPIDLIFGVETFYDLLREGQFKNGPGQPILQNTALGWVVSGRISGASNQQITHSFAHVCTGSSIDEQLSRFWEVESCQTNSILSMEETECEQHFTQTAKRDPSGRFIVALPKKDSVIAQLGNSKDIAYRRFLSIERRLIANPSLKETYSAFIHEYADLGHMKLIDDNTNPHTQTYYMPHHCVVRPDSITTKLRVVFDASCSSDTGVSLNDGLKVGPVIQDDLLTIILRFRMPQFAIISDIEKMYRQIQVVESDQPLQRILWRDSPLQSIQTYQMTTVTYGTSSAPYLATKCLQKLSEDSSTSHPVAAAVIGKDFYMDDLLTGANSVDEGRELCKQLIELTNSAGFQLRKWASNSSEILTDIPTHMRDERTLLELDSSGSPIKTLGLHWDTAADHFCFEVPKHSDRLPITKRIVLSDIARLFDPLGLVGPVVVQAKLLMQDLWREGKEWDEPLCDSHQQRWFEFRDGLQDLSSLKIPRWVVSAPDIVCIELHGFSDASERAYGACIYLRAVSSVGNIFVKLLTAKSKVAPMGKSKKGSTISLPRLELSAALLLSHLFEKVQSSLDLKVSCFFWTDSTIVLHWIAANPSRWKTFVANRSSEIQRITTKGIWAHVPGTENPADIISRGMSPSHLHDCSMWWNGPPWLSQPSRFWPPLVRSTTDNFAPEELEERSVLLTAQAQPPNELFSLCSSFSHLVRIVALVQRFSHNCRVRDSSEQCNGFLTTVELKEATQLLVKLAQEERFAQDLTDVSRSGQVKPNSRLKALAPALVDGILRVGGRLRNAPVTYDQRHPMILPDNHPLTELVLRCYHQKLLHAGPQLLTAAVREKFWPLRIRNLARQVVHSCVSCFRCKPKVLEQLMGELPPERVTPALPFLRTGVDYCGPFYYRVVNRTVPVKCFVAIFVCLVTKAVHVECVGNLSTNAFLAALRRFVARRGRPEIIQCDNATNFKGADRELNELARLFRSQQHQDLVTHSCADDGITFKFIPPRSPNFGGLWEAAVKSLKKHMRSTLGNVIMHHDDFVTLLTQIESCLNSRPLTQLSSDPNDLEVLTPGHFLVHRSLTAIPEPSLEGIPANRLDQWQQTQEYVRRIWKQWQSEYLSGLQPRTRWTRQRDNIAVGTMVLIKEENLPPLKWRFGRVVHVFRAEDNNVRVVAVRTKDGEFRRTISKICILPVHQPSQPTSGVPTGMPEGK